METLVKANFASPLANADKNLPFSSSDSGLFKGIYHGLNVWTVALMLLFAAVAYDQCPAPRAVPIQIAQLLTCHRQLCLAEGFYRGSDIQDTFYRTFHRICTPRLSEVCGKMEQWRVELRLRLSQVRFRDMW